MPNNPFEAFLLWEATSRDTIDFKKIYVDMANDLNAGLMLSEIVYWYLPSKEDGSSRLRVEHDKHYWIACRRYEWWDRTRLSPEKAERAIVLLLESKLIIKAIYKFAGSPTVHVRINQDVFMNLWTQTMKNPPLNPYKPAEDSDLGKTLKSISGNPPNENGGKPKMKKGKTPKSLTETPASTPASNTVISGGDSAATFKHRIDSIIEVWAKGWEGEVSGNPYSNRTNRADAKKLAVKVSLDDISRYTLALKQPGKRWANARPSWGIWFNDMGEWLIANPAPNQPSPPKSTPPVERSEAMKKALHKKLGETS